MATATTTKWVYAFEEGGREMRDLLGGKGANVAEMTRILGAERVPAGFTITTEACVAYMNADRQEPEGLDDQVDEALSRLEEHVGKRLGDSDDPLLVSVRSGARSSMPGMMDTVLNLGLNDESVEGLAKQTSDDRFAYDSYRRFVAMYGRIVLGVDAAKFDEPLEELKERTGAASDAAIPADALRDLVAAYKDIVQAETGEPFPQSPEDQMRGAIEAVFKSWDGKRARDYRVRERISHDLGTAVN